MAQNLVINGVTYNSVSSLSIPKSGGGNAVFPDTSDATAVAGDIASGKTAYVGGSKVTGTATGGGGATAYTISCNETDPNVFLYTQHGVAGDRIVTYHQDSGFMDFNITIKDASNNTISYTARDSNCWYFTMPASNVTITVDYM